jgi:hypothetical protein
MNEPGGGGHELAWILWTIVAILFLIFGIAEIVGPQHAISFWLLGGLLLTICSSPMWGLSRPGKRAVTDARRERIQRWVVRIAIGALAAGAGYFAVSFTIHRHADLPSVALGQVLVYRIEICLAIAYGGLLLLTPLFHGLIRGMLPSRISQQGAEWPQAVSATKENIDDLEEAVKQLQGDSTYLRARIAELLAATAGNP